MSDCCSFAADILWILILQKNKIEMLNMIGARQLIYLDVSHNQLMNIHGLDGCSSLRHLDLSHNKITRVGKSCCICSVDAAGNCCYLCNACIVEYHLFRNNSAETEPMWTKLQRDVGLGGTVFLPSVQREQMVEKNAVLLTFCHDYDV